MKIKSLFPVQQQIIPIISNSDNVLPIYPNDLCVLAPTGSGKTLAYVLPIIHSLKTYIRPACRAIVLLPVSDLAEQVYDVVEKCLNGDYDNMRSLFDKSDPNNDVRNSRRLRAILLSNKTPFAKEQSCLIDPEHQKCLIDIIISTPGRLVDHIQKTRDFNISELRYLVLDECDRIVEHIKQNWLETLNHEIFSKQQRLILTSDLLNVNNVIFSKERLVPLQKLLFSATLTRNPEKLEQLQLFLPLFFNVGSEVENKEKNDGSLNYVSQKSESEGEQSVSKKIDEVLKARFL